MRFRRISKRMLLITIMTAFGIMLFNLIPHFLLNNTIIATLLITLILIGFISYIYILRKEAEKKGKVAIT
jgi:phosphatidylglycerophosphate synthase